MGRRPLPRAVSWNVLAWPRQSLGATGMKAEGCRPCWALLGRPAVLPTHGVSLGSTARPALRPGVEPEK